MTATPEETDTITFPLTEESRKEIEQRVTRMRHANSVMIGKIQHLTGQNPDFAAAMITTFFESMVELGMIEEDTWLAMQLMWEERFHENLRKFTADVQNAVETAQRQAAVQQIVPRGAGKLIVPPGVQRRRVRDEPQA